MNSDSNKPFDTIKSDEMILLDIQNEQLEKARAKDVLAMSCIEELRSALEKSVKENEELVKDMNRLIDTCERTHREKKQLEKLNLEVEDMLHQKEKEITACEVRMERKLFEKEEEWKKERDSLKAQLNSCQEALEHQLTLNESLHKRHTKENQKNNYKSDHTKTDDDGTCMSFYSGRSYAESASTGHSNMLRSVHSYNKIEDQSIRSSRRDKGPKDSPSLEVDPAEYMEPDQPCHQISNQKKNSSNPTTRRKNNKSFHQTFADVELSSASSLDVDHLQHAEQSESLASLSSKETKSSSRQGTQDEGQPCANSTYRRLLLASRRNSLIASESRSSSDKKVQMKSKNFAEIRNRPSWLVESNMIAGDESANARTRVTRTYTRRRSFITDSTGAGDQDRQAMRRLVEQAKFHASFNDVS